MRGCVVNPPRANDVKSTVVIAPRFNYVTGTAISATKYNWPALAVVNSNFRCKADDCCIRQIFHISTHCLHATTKVLHTCHSASYASTRSAV